jgi:hypothetical protein
LYAFTKKDGGIRLSAVDCTLRRLVAKAACKAVKLRVTSMQAPTQLGFGVGHKSGAAAHAVRRFVKDLGPGMAMFQLYFTKACIQQHT